MILRMKRAKTVSTAGRDHLNAARPARISGANLQLKCGHFRREATDLRIVNLRRIWRICVREKVWQPSIAKRQRGVRSDRSLWQEKDCDQDFARRIANNLRSQTFYGESEPQDSGPAEVWRADWQAGCE